jgi:hypothetical protein
LTGFDFSADPIIGSAWRFDLPNLRGTGEQLVRLLKRLLQYVEQEKKRMLGQ